MEGTASKPRKPQLGEVLEAEVLVTYLWRRRGTLTQYRDCIIIFSGFGEERFDLVQTASGVRWQRTR